MNVLQIGVDHGDLIGHLAAVTGTNRRYRQFATMT